MPLATIEEAIEDIRRGKMVILMDDKDRENEGDLCMAAEMVTPQAINFMATHGRGLICLSLTEERCDALRLPLMVERNTSTHGTAFTASIDAEGTAVEGSMTGRGRVTRGVSGADRAATVRAAIDPATRPDDLVRPGHVFP